MHVRIARRPSPRARHEPRDRRDQLLGPIRVSGTRGIGDLKVTGQVRIKLATLGGVDEVMHALADPSRRTVLEIVRDHEATAGELADALPIARPGVSRHLRVLRQAGLVDVRQDGQRRIYSLRPEGLIEVDEWLEAYRVLWRNRLDALHTEVKRGRRVMK